MKRPVKKGDEFGWTTLGGDTHYGRVKDVDGDVVVVICEHHPEKEECVGRLLEDER